MSKTHTRNVAGYNLKKFANAVYQQDLSDGKRRWFVRYRLKQLKKYIWRYTEPFEPGESPQNQSIKRFETLTDAVMTANSR